VEPSGVEADAPLLKGDIRWHCPDRKGGRTIWRNYLGIGGGQRECAGTKVEQSPRDL